MVSLCFPRQEWYAEASVVFAEVTASGLVFALVSAVLILGGILLV